MFEVMEVDAHTQFRFYAGYFDSIRNPAGALELAGELTLTTNEFLSLYKRLRSGQDTPLISYNSDPAALRGLAQLAPPDIADEINDWLRIRG